LYAFLGVDLMYSLATFFGMPTLLLPDAAAYIAFCCCLDLIGILQARQLDLAQDRQQQLQRHLRRDLIQDLR